MTSPRRFEQDLPALLTDLYVAGIPDYRDDLVQRIAATRQRPAWTFRERWLPMDLVTERVSTPRLPWRAIGVLAMIALLLATALAFYVGSRPRLPDPFGPAVNGDIVYTAGGDVFAQDAVGGPSRLLIKGPANDFGIDFSPIGTALLLARETDAGFDLLVANPDGTEVRRIGGPYVEPGRIEWSPDARMIAVAHDVEGVETISLVQADGSGEQRLLTGMPSDEPTWRPPNGAQLAFRGRAGDAWGLYVIDADGTGLQQMELPRSFMEDPYEVLRPAWAPAGDRIAVHRLVETPGEGNGNGFRITIADVDPAGTVTTHDTPTFLEGSDDEFSVSWLPDGEAIAFLRRDGEVDSVAMATLRGESIVRDFDVTSIGEFGGLGLSVFPDGRTIGVHRFQDGSDYQIEVTSETVTRRDSTSEDGVRIQRLAP